ncbi:exonuclease domain-containing protein [Cohaesibacter intestini]|uniref:exonuclease domain-containing protein n=1 Tax=Cohaesibacter intestini TaxID=2211145 RepID=UPI000DEB1FB6|nr:exonuclease domain-containing protein [Cohaesibacter intestini]
MPSNRCQSPNQVRAPLPKGPFRFFALDVETANNDRSSICQIGIAGVKDSGEIETWSTYINPETSNWSCSWVHGISQKDVAHAPSFPAALSHLMPLLNGQVVFQHSSFDKSAINAACDLHRQECPDWDWRDSVLIARQAWPELKGRGGHGLKSLKQHLGLVFRHHDGEEDARAAAEVVLRAEAHLGQRLVGVKQGSKQEESATATPKGNRAKFPKDCRMQLKAQIVQMLDAVAIEHPSGHQKTYANRYVLKASHGRPIEIMFEKGENTPANLWVLSRFVSSIEDGSIPFVSSKAGSGRHSALNTMSQLSHGDLTRFRLESVQDFRRIMSALEAH